MSYQLAELAERFGLELHGEGDTIIDGVSSLAAGKPGRLAFLADSRHRKALESSQASAVLIKREDLPVWQGPALISDNPQASFARIAALYDRIRRPAPGIHPSAWVDETAVLGEGVYVGPQAVVERGAVLGEGVVIGPGCLVGEDVSVGAGSWLTANVTLYHRVQLGERVHIQPGAVIGGRGFGLAAEDGRWLEVPQLGTVRIGDDVEIGANTCIDRGAMDDTVLEEGVKLDNLVQVGHNAHIGAHTAIAGCAGIAGSCVIGERCQIGGAVGIAGHLRVADDVVVTAKSLVSSSLEGPGLYSSGLPVAPAREWRRQVARLRNIDELARKVQRLEKQSKQGREKE